MNNILSVDNLSVGFHTYRGDITAVRGVSFDLSQGEILCIVGESGCGKSVTAHAVMGLLPKENSFIKGGKIIFEGRDITNLPAKEMREDCEKFFRSEWFGQLTGIDGSFILQKLKQEAELDDS